MTTPLAWPFQRRLEDDAIHAEVVHIDGFGNLITNLERRAFEEWLAGRDSAPARVAVAGRHVEGIAGTYSAVPASGLVALFESTGCLEIAIRAGNAAYTLSVLRGDEITITV